MRGTPGFLSALTPQQEDRLRELATEVRLPADQRLFHEGRKADRFWVLLSGSVVLDLRPPGEHPLMVETLHGGDLLGWSWLFAPHTWQLSARTHTAVHALEFPADQVRSLCDRDPELGRDLVRAVAQVIARRLQRSRQRLVSRVDDDPEL
ncbi:cyclic nucleotide-binding domain-containing protein [Streptomyces sp. NPDC005438]|uniref:Crp/Fnr family transcriptional regulator n=1 Tax=Streptomyces sp. NPDC005438 TaxID=3156880 RepID=UPI0033BD3131